MAAVQRSSTKAPSEVRDIAYDFSSELAIGETIASQSVTVYYNQSPPTAATASGDLAAAGVTLLQAGVVGCVLSQGNFGVDYLVTFVANTSAGQVIPRSIAQYVGQT